MHHFDFLGISHRDFLRILSPVSDHYTTILHQSLGLGIALSRFLADLNSKIE